MDLSDSEEEFADDAMGRTKRAGGAAAGSVNKKGVTLYSREDIREQYCINDKELEVLDRSQRKGFLGCFSNQGKQVGKNETITARFIFTLPIPL